MKSSVMNKSFLVAAIFIVAAFAGFIVVGEDTDATAAATITYKMGDDPNSESTTRAVPEGALTFVAPYPEDLGLSCGDKDFLNWTVPGTDPAIIYRAGMEYPIPEEGKNTLVAVYDETVYVTLVIGEQSFKCPVDETDGKIKVDSDNYKAAKAAMGAIDTDRFVVGDFTDADKKTVIKVKDLENQIFSESIVLTLDLTPIYYVSFYMDEATMVSKVGTNVRGGITAPVDPSKEHYTFIGWFTEDGVEFDSKLVPEADMAFYAQFEPITYAVHFVVGDESVTERSSKYGFQIDLPEVPAGYKAWADEEGNVVESPVTILGETTFYAVAEVYYTVTFMNGEEVVSTFQVLEDTAIPGDKIPAVPEGCSGWNTIPDKVVADVQIDAIPFVYYTVVFDFEDKNFDNVSVEVISGQTIPADKVPAIPENFPKEDVKWDVDLSAPVTSDMTVKLVPNEYVTVTFMAGEDVVAEVVILKDTSVPADKVPAVPEGFVNWQYEADQTFGADATIVAEKEFVPTVFDVTFKIEGKTPISQKSDSMVVPNTDREGYAFQGWVVEGETQYVDPMTYPIESDITFVAVYKEIAPPAPAEPGFFSTPAGQCVAVLVVFAIGVLGYMIHIGKIELPKFKISRVKEENKP